MSGLTVWSGRHDHLNLEVGAISNFSLRKTDLLARSEQAGQQLKNRVQVREMILTAAEEKVCGLGGEGRGGQTSDREQ